MFFVKGLIGGGVVALFIKFFGEILYYDKKDVLEQHLFNGNGFGFYIHVFI
jgi:hypothetical protein